MVGILYRVSFNGKVFIIKAFVCVIFIDFLLVKESYMWSLEVVWKGLYNVEGMFVERR